MVESIESVTLSDEEGQENAHMPIWRQNSVGQHAVRAAHERPFCPVVPFVPLG